jgi:peptidoglycan/xylan/chitin deacetylase (PgdA/CDA1 family)
MFPNAITNVETDESVVALTFDDGPHPVYTPRLLRILEKHAAKATFFLVGEAANRHPEIVGMIAKAGHVIGNHAWNHRNLTSIRSRLRRLKQLWACTRAITPYHSRLFRPPYGAQNRRVRLDASILGYKIILWNASAQDWVPQGSDEIAQKIIDRAVPGSIFLLHDAIYRSHLPESETQMDREPMLDGLEQALVVLNKRIRFVTVTELLKTGRTVCNWPIKRMP